MAEDKIITSGKPGKSEETIKFSDRVTVYSTDLDKFHKTGAEISVHPKQAEAMIARGVASEQPQKSKSKKDQEA